MPLTENDFEYRRTETYDEIAIYGEVNYHINEQWTLTGGLRWFDNESAVEGIFGFPLVDDPALASEEISEVRHKDDDILYKVNVSYSPTEAVTLYGTISEGYRRAGANMVAATGAFAEPNIETIQAFDSDSATNYELGIKGSTANHAYTIAAFYVDWDTPQLNTASALFGFRIVENGEAAHTSGLEVDLNGVFTDTIYYRFGYTWLDRELDADLLGGQFGNIVATEGSTLPGTAEHVASAVLGGNWTLSGNLGLQVEANAYYQSETENFISADSPLAVAYDLFVLWGLMANLSVGDNWTLSLYGKNLGNEAGPMGGHPSTFRSYDNGIFSGWYGNANYQFVNQPRTWGVGARYRF